MDKDLIKKFGSGAFITGDQLKNYQHAIVHVSPKIDFMIGGGIPGGSVVTIAGDPKCGKSVTGLHILGKAQQVGRPVFYLNVEGRIKTRDIEGIKCLDIKQLNIVRSYKDEDASRILTAEEFLYIAEHIIHDNPGAVLVIDSISQLVSSGELDKDMGEASRAPGAILMAQFCRKVSNIIAINDIILIGILHFIANTSGFGKLKLASGGNKIKYAMDVGMECQKFSFRRKDGKDDGPIIGQEVQWITTSAALGPPGNTCTSIIEYGIGIDEVAELVDLAVEFAFIEQNKSWYETVFQGDKAQKFQGMSKLTNYIRENPDVFNELNHAVMELLYGG